MENIAETKRKVIINMLQNLEWIPSGNFSSPELDYCIQFLDNINIEELDRIFRTEFCESIPNYYRNR